MRGRVFEKVGVNVSTVWGESRPEFAGQIPGAERGRRASGRAASRWSPICARPHVPAGAHEHAPHPHHQGLVRRRRRPQPDLSRRRTTPRPSTPALQAACDAYDPDCHARFKRWADEYFFLPHRGEPRGVGGIFYDYLEGDLERDFAFTRAVGEAFLDIYPGSCAATWTGPGPRPSAPHQLVRRGRYVEFNLLYDRGTQFGLKTGGNTEAILMSLPPVVTWP